MEKQSLAPPIGKEGQFLVNMFAEGTDWRYKSVESAYSTNDSFKSLKTTLTGKDDIDRLIDVYKEPRRNSKSRQNLAGHPPLRAEKSLAMLRGLRRDSKLNSTTERG